MEGQAHKMIRAFGHWLIAFVLVAQLAAPGALALLAMDTPIPSACACGPDCSCSFETTEGSCCTPITSPGPQFNDTGCPCCPSQEQAVASAKTSPKVLPDIATLLPKPVSPGLVISSSMILTDGPDLDPPDQVPKGE